VVGIGTFIVGYSRSGPWPLLAGGSIIGVGVASMHYLGMAAIRVPDRVTYNPTIVAASVVIAIIAGIAALWAALRLDTLLSTLVASLIMGIAVSGMHYTGMAALQVYANPSAHVSTSATASAAALLLPLILGLSSVGFIFSAVIALSPTASEILEEDELMKRIGQTAQFQQAHDQQYGRQPYPGAQSRPVQSRPVQFRPAHSQPTQSQPAEGEPPLPQPRDLFRPRNPRPRGDDRPLPRRIPGGSREEPDVAVEPGAQGPGRSVEGH
jgi:hypothetical protein